MEDELDPPNEALVEAAEKYKEEVKPAGLTAQVKEARTVVPRRKRITMPDNGLSGIVRRTDKTQPGEI